MTDSGSRPLAVAFAAAALVTLVLGIVTWSLTRELRDAVQWVTHSHEVVRTINRLRVAVLDHETATRGFALTGDERFLAPEEAADAAMPLELRTLRELMADNADQRAHLDRLAPLIDAKEAFDDRVIAARQAEGIGAAGAAVASGQGLALMEQIRELLTELRDEEGRLLGARTAALAGSEQRALVSMVLLAVGAAASLALGYASVARALRERQRAAARLDDARRFAEGIVNGMREPLLVFDDSLHLLSANRAFYQLFATTPAATTGRRLAELAVANPALGRLTSRLAEVLVCGEALDDFQFDAEVPGAGPRTLLLNARRIEDADQRRLLLAIEDATDRQRVSQLEVERRALERTNRELQEFAYVASHDLQEPLRKMRTFAERLTGRHAAGLTEEGRDHLTRIANGAERMQRLIDDLLAFSRVTTAARPFVPVDLAAVAREVLSDLEPRLQADGGQVEVGPLPVVDGDPTQMRQLLQNLLVNALKFRRPDAAPLVRVEAEIGGTTAAATCTLRVADNGIGFDEKYLDRIFTIFQRLHGRGEYEGTGLGLAICRKIVERHRGAITALSRPGAGATFVVTLPVRQPGIQEAA